MKKSTFIDYNVIMAARSHRKKKPAHVKQKPAVMGVNHTNAGPEKDALRKIAVYSKELVA